MVLCVPCGWTTITSAIAVQHSSRQSNRHHRQISVCRLRNFNEQFVNTLFIGTDISIAARKEWKKRKEILKTSANTNHEPMLDGDVGAVPFDNFETICTTAIVDVDKLYTDYVNELTAKRRALQGPQSLCLNEFEINLRKYRIIGGVFCVEYFEQPQQDTKHSSNSYLRTSACATFWSERLLMIFGLLILQSLVRIHWSDAIFFNTTEHRRQCRPGCGVYPKSLRPKWKQSKVVWINWHT